MKMQKIKLLILTLVVATVFAVVATTTNTFAAVDSGGGTSSTAQPGAGGITSPSNAAYNCGRDNGTTAAGSSNVNNCVDNIAVPLTNDTDFVAKYLNPFIKFLSAVVGLAVAIGVIVGGIEYATSAGDPQKAASGKKHIVNAFFALVVYALSLSILNFLIPGGIQVINV